MDGTVKTLNTAAILKIGVVANIIEWYEFCVYGYLAGVIGQLFFKQTNPGLSIIQAFFLFSISYLIRPLGSIFFGYVGDKYGRNIALNCSLLMMSIPTFLIGVLPTYQDIGLTAMFLLLVLRVIQGFAAGGELPISACYVYESALLKNRSILCSSVSVSSLLGVLCGSLVVTILSSIFTNEEVIQWAWRIPFWLGCPLTIIVFYLRCDLVKTSFLTTIQKQKTIEIKNIYPQLFQAILLVAFLQVSFYLLFVWMPSYLKYFLNISSEIASFTNTITLCSMALLCLLSGYAPKYVGRKTILLVGVVLTTFLVYPLFLLLINYPSEDMLLLVQILFAICVSLVNGVMMETLGSLFAAQNRCLGVGVGFTFAAAFLGGTAPTVCSYVIYKTGIFIFPAFYIMLFGLIALPVALRLR